MVRMKAGLWLGTWLLAWCGLAWAGPWGDASAGATAGMGVNIHFTDPRAGEMDMIARAGFKWIRMDLSWDATEREPGVYDFSAYQRLLAELDQRGMRAVLILDYSNPHYDGGSSPRTDAGRRAFAKWATEAAKTFRGRGVIWEMYNEPNIGFWRPQPNVNDYVALAREVGKAIRATAPQETYVGPATSRVDFAFLEDCFKGGLLDYFDAVSVHPYRSSNPETAEEELRALRGMIEKYRRGNPGMGEAARGIPILSGEWGYSTAPGHVDEETQGNFLARELLFNLSQGVPLSIWYDWHDDGPDPNEGEHHFGTVRYEYHKRPSEAYEPKPAYHEMERLNRAVGGWKFSKRLWVGDAEDFVLVFTRGDAVKLAAWTCGHAEKTVKTALGEIKLSNHVEYQEVSGDMVRLVGAWDAVPTEVWLRGAVPGHVHTVLKNVLDRPVRINGTEVRPGETATIAADVGPTLSEKPVAVDLSMEVDGLGRLVQRTYGVSLTPVVATALSRQADELPVRVENPSGEDFHGNVRVNGQDVPLEFAKGQTEQVVRARIDGRGDEYRVGLSVVDGRGRPMSGGEVRTYRELRLTNDQVRAVQDGDPAVNAEAAVEDLSDQPQSGGAEGITVTYRFAQGWKFVRVEMKEATALEGRPTAMGMWVAGDGSGNILRCRFTDTTGQTFQPEGIPVDWRGWRYVEMPLDRAHSTSWGGKADGRIHYPIRLAVPVLIDSAVRKQTSGKMSFKGFVVIRETKEREAGPAPAGAQ